MIRLPLALTLVLALVACVADDGSTGESPPDARPLDAMATDLAAEPDAAAPDTTPPDTDEIDGGPDADAGLAPGPPSGFRTATLERVGDLPAGVHGLAMSEDGTLYFTDTFRNRDAISRLYRLTPPYDGAPDATQVEGDTLAGLTFARDRLYICDAGADDITVVGDNRRGHIPAPPCWNLSGGPTGRFVVTVGGQLLRADDAEPIDVLADGLAAPFDLVPDPDGRGLWVSEQVSAADDGRVTLRDPSGAVLREIEHPWSNPEGLGIDQHGTLWVAETGAGALLRFDRTTGELLETHPVPGLPVVLAPDPIDGGLLVAITGADPSWWRVIIPD